MSTTRQEEDASIVLGIRTGEEANYSIPLKQEVSSIGELIKSQGPNDVHY